MNGLGQALATEQAAAGPPPRKAPDKAAHDELYNNVQRWLCRDHGGVYPGTSDLLHAIVTHDESRYLHAQAEVLSWLDWHKKCCRALFPKDGDD